MSDERVDEIPAVSRDAIPAAVYLFICDRCGRKGFSSLEIRPGHWRHGERCGGTVLEVRYVRA